MSRAALVLLIPVDANGKRQTLCQQGRNNQIDFSGGQSVAEKAIGKNSAYVLKLKTCVFPYIVRRRMLDLRTRKIA